jgi:TolA-binding protein
MTRLAEFHENLAVHARRGTLSTEQRRELEQLLSTSAAARAAFEIGQDFDRADTVQPGDEALVERFVAGALRASNRRLAPFANPKRVVAWLLAASVFGFCGLALGLRGTWLYRLAPVQQAAPPALARSTPKAVTPRRVTGERRDGASAETTPIKIDNSVSPASPRASIFVGVVHSTSKEVSPEPSASAAATSSAVETSTRAMSAAEPSANAETLFRQASEARRLGDIERAIALLRALQQTYPGSPEARISYVSLGKLYMSRGAAAGAVEAFSAYLSSGGPLSEEALLGRAQALLALGRNIEERQTWQLLLARYPGSVYAVQARERIRALGGESLR